VDVLREMERGGLFFKTGFDPVSIQKI